jgi:hypothetical protein
VGHCSEARHRGELERENLMASKDKGGRSSKTAAAHTPKEKKQAKRDKKKTKSTSAKDL